MAAATNTKAHRAATFPLRRHSLWVIVGAALAFGVLDSVLKGNGDDVRGAIGNASAPWLLLPFVAAAVGARRIPGGAMIGLAVSVVALTGFYVANAFVLDLGPHSWLVDLRLALPGELEYLKWGVISGPVFGGLGAWWSRTRSIGVPLLVASLFALEPVALWCAHLSARPILWVIEPPAGVVAMLAICFWYLVPMEELG